MAKKTKLATLDLHGFKVDEVFDAVDKFLVKHQNKARVKIMPGKGTGAVRKQLISYLKLGHYPWEYEVLDSGQKNTGVVIVFLAD